VAMVRASCGRWPEAYETSRTVLPYRENTTFTETAVILENTQMTGIEFERPFTPAEEDLTRKTCGCLYSALLA